MHMTLPPPPPPPRALSSSPLPTTEPLLPSTPLTPAVPPLAAMPRAAGPLGDVDLDADRVQVWLAQQSRLDIDFGRAEGAHMFDAPAEPVPHEDHDEGEEAAHAYVGYAAYRASAADPEALQDKEVAARKADEEREVGEVMQRLGLALGLGPEEEEGEAWARRCRFDVNVQKEEEMVEGFRIPGARRSPASSSPSRADSPVLGFPSAESLLLPPALSRGRSASLSGRSSADPAHAYNALAEAGIEDVTSDPLRRPGRHYVRALPEGAREAAPVRGSGCAVLYAEEEEADAYEAAYAYVDAGGVVGSEAGHESGMDVGRDKPLPTLPPRSPSASPPPAAEMPGSTAAFGVEAIIDTTAQHQHQHQHQPYHSPQPQPHPLSRRPSHTRTQSSRSQSRRNSNAAHPHSHSTSPLIPSAAYTYLQPQTHSPSSSQSSYYHPHAPAGVAASARQAQFAIGPGPGTPPVSRRASQSNLLGVGAGGAGGSLSRRPSLLRMPSLPLLGESAEPPASGEAGGGVQPQYHLPLGMQVRRARSRSTMLLASASVSGDASESRAEEAAEPVGGVSLSSSLSSLRQSPPAPAPRAPSPPLLQASPLPPSAPPTRRSRAGSLGAAMSLASPYESQRPGLHRDARSVENISVSASGIRDAVYIDSAEVGARLDRLLAGLEDAGVEGLGAEDAAAREDEGEIVREGEDGMGEDGLEEGQDYTLTTSFAAMPVDDDVDPDAANALRTPPSAARAGVFRQSTVTSRAPPNTPMTPSYTPSYGLAQQQQQSHHLPQEEHSPSHKGPQHRAQRSHASLHSVRSAGSRGSSSLGSHGGGGGSSAHGSRGGSLSASLSSSGSLKRPHPYQHAQASASQVYVGPGLAAAGGHARTPSAQQQQQQQQHARGASGGSSPPRSQQGHPRSRASSVAHSRAASSGAAHSRSASVQPPLAAPGQAHSRTSSAAHSRAGSVVLLAPQPPTPPMHIPVPVPVRAAVPSARPTRPPPAPPLDVVALELGLVGVGPEVEIKERGEDEVMGAEMGMGMDGEEAEEAIVADLEGGRDDEEEEDDETSEDERERLQFLRGLGLEDRMREFKGVEFPSGLDDDDDGAEFGTVRDDGKFGAEQGEFLASHVNEEGMLVVASDGPGNLSPSMAPPEMQRSMSRWSLGSSTMEEPLEDTNAGIAKKDRRRKSFASPFGLGGDAVDGSTLSTIAGTSSPTGTGSGKEKKRGRLASFISRLSGVGANGTLPSTPISLPPPPLPTSPTTPSAPPSLLPSPLIVEAGLRKMQSKDSVMGVVPGAWEPRPLQHTWEYQAPKPKKQQQQQKQPSSPALSKSVPSSPAGRMRNPPLPLPQVNVNASAQGNGVGKSASAQDVLGGSLSAATNRKLAGRVVAWDANTTGDALERNEKTTMPMGLRARANTSVGVGVGARAFWNAAYAVGAGQRRTPVPIHTGMSPYHGGPTVVVDDSMPPTPTSLASTEIDEEDEYEEDEGEEDYGVEVDESNRAQREQEYEERWARLKMANDAVAEGYRPYQQQALPPIPQSPPPPPPPGHSASVTLIESTLKALAPSPSTSSLAAQQGDTRQRLKSMPSLTLAPAPQAAAAVMPSPLASASTTNFGLAPSITSARPGKGFRGFVERMGLGGSSANSINSSPSSSHPGTPIYATPLSAMPLQLSIPGSSATVPGQFAPSPSPAASNNRSPSHSPTASLSLGAAHKEGGVFTHGGLLGKKKPKRKLVISGVAPENVRGYEAVKRWCEAFGEVREMTRASNGKLYVDFKKASVAETVCRIQAQVFIKGAGSVSLSWYTKKKPL
ncbi:hypothetical protein BJ912DRAFT_1055512 [Pholiota molesta]|nr:hypothetical protein BJ912DRAFT_1055512 [Pholiota molesta]